MQIVGGAAVGFQPLEVTFPLLLLEKIPHRIVRREHRSGVSHLLPHVRDHMAVHRGQPFQARPIVLDDVPGTALHSVAAKHFQDDILGTHPIRQFPGQLHAHDLRHVEIERFSTHGYGHSQTASPHCQHSQGTGSAGMAVGAKKGLARFSKAFHVHRMADAGPGRAEPQAEPLTGTTQEQVIIGVAVVSLQQVVVNVLR